MYYSSIVNYKFKKDLILAVFSHPIEPIVFDDSEMLILGSFPSLKSFEHEFYYAHPKNQFWPIMSKIYGLPAETRDQKIKLLRSSKIALWDVIASCERENSSDANLKNVAPNDIKSLLAAHPGIKRIFFTGGAAAKFYRKYFGHLEIQTAILPSPSPAYASMKFEEKLFAWKSIIAG